MKNLTFFCWFLFIAICSDAQNKNALVHKQNSAPDTSVFAFVEGGNFSMGRNVGIEAHEKPEHQVNVHDFFISKFEITYNDFDRYTDSMKLPRNGDMDWGRSSHPVMVVSWLDAVGYCNWLSIQDHLIPCYVINGYDVIWSDTANGYRLPTEAEWEYAARGGRRSQKNLYAGSNQPGAVAWFKDNSDGKSQPVAGKAANELGLFDMSGNLWEWVWDVYDAAYYQISPVNNPTGPVHGPYRVMRGGAWYNNADYITVSARQYHSPDFRQTSVGFRIARNK